MGLITLPSNALGVSCDGGTAGSRRSDALVGALVVTELLSSRELN
jgi:hypothetical protein